MRKLEIDDFDSLSFQMFYPSDIIVQDSLKLVLKFFFISKTYAAKGEKSQN